MDVLSSDDKKQFIKIAQIIMIEHAPAVDMVVRDTLIEGINREIESIPDKEINRLVSSAISMLDEMEISPQIVNKYLKKYELSEYLYFKKLQSNILDKILKMKNIKNYSDAMVLRDARDSKVFNRDQLSHVNKLLNSWE